MRFWVTFIIVVGLPFVIRWLKLKRATVGLLLIAYMITILIITLGTRSYSSETHIGLNPFIVYERAIRSVIQGWQTGGWREALKHLGWHRGQLASVGLNTLLFVPLGYLVPMVSPFFRHGGRVLLLGFVCSLTIEIVQVTTHLGWFDTSDLLHNTIGVWIGWIIYRKILTERKGKTGQA